MKTKILSVNDIKIDKETYPRISYDFVTSARYYNAMKSGAEFPLITVGKIDEVYYLVDGLHRLTAIKQLKQTDISCEVIPLKDKQELYLEAIKRNMQHGKQFSTQEVAKIVITLQNMKVEPLMISQMVRLPVDSLSRFVAKRATLITESDGSIKNIAIKSTLKHLAGTQQPIEFEAEMNHEMMASSRSQISYLDTFITMLENKWINMEDPVILKKLNRIIELFSKLVIPAKEVKSKK